MRFDSIIIGGGPAGLASATRLAMTGEKVLLVEQRSLPQRKCCGEFLHPSAVQELGLLGHTPKGTLINRVQIVSGKVARDFPMTVHALSMERDALSSLLLNSAVSAGVQIVTHCVAAVGNVKDVSVEILAGKDRYVADKVIAAEGSSSMIVRRFGDNHKLSRVVYGFSTRLSARFPSGVALAAVRGGYAGLCDLGNGSVNLAGLLSENAYHRLSPNRTNFGMRLLAEIPAWEGIVPPSTRGTLFQVPVCADVPRFGDVWPPRIFVSGDAAGMRETAFGDGIARALRQARLLEESLHRYPDILKAARDYASRLVSDAHRPNRRLLKMTGRCLRSPFVVSMLLTSGALWIGKLVKRATTSAQTPIHPLNTSPAAALPRTT